MKDGWVRLPPAAMPMMAGFGRIANPCPAPVVIVSASSPAFGEVSLHETRIVDGVNRMRELEQLRIVPDGDAIFKPGGMHLMLMQPHAPLKEGSKVVVGLQAAGRARDPCPNWWCGKPHPESASGIAGWSESAQAARTASGNGTLLPVCVSIHTMTTLPSL